jgi:hypothetical protein
MAAESQNYELWDTNTFLGVMRDMKADPLYWLGWFTNQAETDATGYIDFEKMPIEGRKLAPFVLPLARGKSIYDDSATGYRFKPAYVKTEDQIDPLMPLTRRVGIDANASQVPTNLSPGQRLNLIRAAMTQAHVNAIRRTWNYMAAVALRDGKITLTGEDYPTTLVDFQRAANHTITLGAGSRFGDAGVSIVDFFQLVIDRMSTADFGGVPTRATMGGDVWNVLRKDAEFKEHLDTNYRNPTMTITRGLVSPAGEMVFKVGEMMVGGGSGQMIELWVDNSTYLDPVTKVSTRYIGAKQILFTASPDKVMGFQAFGAIIDRSANWTATPIFPKNWVTQGDVEVEYITHKSAPLMVPINPNATLLANVLA